MISRRDKQMLSDFGFKDYNDLKQYFNTQRHSIKVRYRKYDFKWRLKMMSKYKNDTSAIKKEIIRFHTQYEDFVIKNQRGNTVNIWPEKSKNQLEYLFERLVQPWKLTKHGNFLFSIQSPDHTDWFRALSTSEFFEAMDICYKASQKTGARVRPWKLRLKANECANSYNQKKDQGALWVSKDYEVALLIAINIIATWDTKTGDWKPWPFLGSWGTLARDHFKYELKHGYAVTKGKSIFSRALYVALKNQNPGRPLQRDVKFQDITNFVFRKGNTGMKQAAFIIASAFAVGGDRAGRIIGSFCDQYNIPKKRLVR
jgi:hypothetical protein